MAAPWNGAATPHCPVPAISQIGGNTNGRIGGRELQEVHHHHPTRRVVSSALRTTSGPAHLSTISSNYYRPAAPRPPPQLGSDFCGKRPKRGISKNNLGRGNSMKCNQSLTAQAVLSDVLNAPLEQPVDNFLKGKRLVLDDYVSLMKELGSRGECSKAVECFKWAVSREKRSNEQGKLVTIMISILGKLGRVDLAQQVFDRAKADGYGKNVYAFSALVSAYGRSGLWKEAISVFELMKRSGCAPNIVTYNAVIDACGKGGVDFKQAMGYFDEMIKRHVKPDRITFNSLIAVCSRGGRWVEAQDLFEQMLHRGIEQDIFTYNTLLDALCKGGQMDLAASALCDMSERNIYPNAITYSTVIDGYAKAGRLNEALDLYHEMKNAGIPLDRVSYNTLLSVYAKFGRFEEALRICREMEDAGFKKDTVTYNALLGGYGKQGKYDQVKALFEEMRWQRVTPNVLTYSTLIDVYSKGGLQTEAMQVLNEFKQTGLKPDVVLYSAYIDALCKSGSVGEAIHLLDKMTAEGITPNVVTCNSIIDSLGRSSKGNSRSYGQSAEFLADNDELIRSLENLSCVSSSPARKNERSNNNANALQIVARNAFASLSIPEEIKQKSEDILGAVDIFHRMKKLGIKPNVVTFSVILNACSRCPSFKEASMLLEELRVFDSRVYGVAHGLLMGFRDRVWSKAQTLFDEVTRMDSATASAFYNALTDMLWHFGQRKGAQLVVLDGRSRQVWENAWCESCLDLHLMSAGAAQAMVHAWLLSIRSIVFEGRELPKLLSILTGWGKHSKVTGDSTLRRAVETLLLTLGAPFHLAKFNEGRFTSTGPVVDAWLRESGTLELLILRDKIVGKAEFAGVHV